MFEFTSEKTNSNFQISVGEEGVVVVYSVDGQIKTRLFVRTTEPHDAQKLVQLLNSDKEASISIYLDTMDQSYVERRIAGNNVFAMNKLAQTQLENVIPKNYLKTFQAIGPSSSTHKDWVYTFVASAYEQPLSIWVEFLLPFPNIIEGIYFLAVELAPIVKQLRIGNDEKPSIFKLKRSSKTNVGWEIIISQNKTGGFRQTAFLNGKIVVSRLLKNISHSDPDVMAGNIEQELVNAIDYIHMYKLEPESPVSVYVILSKNILRFIRTDKIKAKNVEILTPYQAAIRLGVSGLSNERDKFFDPVFLAYCAVHRVREKRMHIEQTKIPYKYAVIVNQLKRGLVTISIIMLLFTAIHLYSFYRDQISIHDLKAQIAEVVKAVNAKTHSIDEMDSNLDDTMPLKQISEIVDLDRFMKKTNESPVTMALRLAEIMPDYARVESFKWSYFDKTLPRFRSIKLTKQVNITDPKEFKVILSLEILFIHDEDSYEEMQKHYEDFKDALKAKFPSAQISVSELPNNTTKPKIEVRIIYPTTAPELIHTNGE